MRTKIPLYLAVAMFIINIFETYITKPTGGWEYQFNSWLFPITALLVVVVCFANYTATDKNFQSEKKFVFILLMVFFLRFLGEVFWAVSGLTNSVVPVPSLADWAWQLSYLLVVVALIYKIKDMFFERKSLILGLVVGACTILSVAYVYYIWPQVSLSGEENILSNIVNFTYTIWDIYVVGLLLVVSYPLVTGYNRFVKTYLYLVLGFLAFAVYDYLFAYKSLNGTYLASGSIDVIDILYFAAYVVVLYSFHLRYQLIKVHKEFHPAAEAELKVKKAGGRK